MEWTIIRMSSNSLSADNISRMFLRDEGLLSFSKMSINMELATLLAMLSEISMLGVKFIRSSALIGCCLSFQHSSVEGQGVGGT